MVKLAVNLISSAAEQADGLAALLIVLIAIAFIIGIAAVVFFLFTWAVMTLFHVQIDFTFMNWLAFIVLAGIFGSGGSSSNS